MKDIRRNKLEKINISDRYVSKYEPKVERIRIPKERVRKHYEYKPFQDDVAMSDDFVSSYGKKKKK
jgi:hypothetical protein